MKNAKERILNDLRDHPDSTAGQVADRLLTHWWQSRSGIDLNLADLQGEGRITATWAIIDGRELQTFRVKEQA